ncbi:sigma-70 family RNA polymerase sigma factor [Mariniphaga sediminis]|jgi:RNA polymerase sigma factor (sigma-70 family)|uniref:Sigma-70 family RNA polymerase sigma factor n=1 Tax=Mariniphaga sediminis TaxID=1628158 RepID=A0A399CXY0_9BACT|nr:sigma-70 family RNA polymerase sigma factor [Mariniphaga sediminis]RIH63332.1 sigma-70 family RNA polymerase sigma factor [Mariniphaga sediminis]
MNKPAENILWNNLKNGDDSALTLIYAKYADNLYSYGLKIINDEALVKDCIHEVFIQLIEKRKSLVVTSNIQIYLFKSLRNKLFEELRSEKRRKQILAQLPGSDDLPKNTIEQLIISTEEQQATERTIKQAIGSLTEHQQELIYLKYTEGLENHEIALLLDIDVASVRTLLYRALKKVRELLKINTQGL